MAVKVTVEAETAQEALQLLSELIPEQYKDVQGNANDEYIAKDLDVEKDKPYSETYAQRTHNSVTDLAEALKASLPTDVEDIKDRLVDLEESRRIIHEAIGRLTKEIEDLQKQVKAVDMQLQGIDLDDEVSELSESVRLIHEEIARVHQRIENVIGTVNDLSLNSDIGCKHEPLIITCDSDGKPYGGNGGWMSLRHWDGYVSDEDKKAGKTVPKNYYRLNGEANDLALFVCRKCNRLYVVATKVEEPLDQGTDPDLDSSCGP